MFNFKSFVKVTTAAAALAFYANSAQAFDLGAALDSLLPPASHTHYDNDFDSDREVASTSRAIVEDPTDGHPGTITVDTKHRYLYLSLDGGRAVRYRVGVGREGFAWQGHAYIGRRAEWPEWTPPADMLKRRPDLPQHMEGGLKNPLGARAMYLYSAKGDTMYRIHGTNEPSSIGHAVSSGCIRMLNDDVVDLYARVKIGTQVNVI